MQASVFLYNAPVHKCLVQMFGCCLQFCASRDEAATAVLAAQFSKQSALLLQLLASISHRSDIEHVGYLPTLCPFCKVYSWIVVLLSITFYVQPGPDQPGPAAHQDRLQPILLQHGEEEY